MVITTPSEVIVESTGFAGDFSFDANTTSAAIVNISLENVRATLPPHTRRLLIHNTNHTEIMAQRFPKSDAPTLSFELNWGFFNYKFKRMTNKP